MIRRFVVFALLLHALYALTWWVLAPSSELRVERYAVTTAVTIAFAAYVVLALAYIKARKSRLNSALAVNKAYWALLIGALILPGQWGTLIRDAPYRVVGSPYSYWIAPAWLRTYLWVFLSITIIGVLVEFVAANWGPRSRGTPDRVIATRMRET